MKQGTITVNRDGSVSEYDKYNDELGPEEASGLLNIFSYELASHVFNEFFICLSVHEDNAKLLKVLRIHKDSNETNNLITTRYKLGRYTKKNVRAYVSQKPDFRKAGLSDQVSFEFEPDGNTNLIGGYIIYEGNTYDDSNSPDISSLRMSDEAKLYRYYYTYGDHNDIVNLVIMFALIKKRYEQDDKYLNNLRDVKSQKHYETIVKTVKERLTEKTKHKGLLWEAPLHIQPYIGVQLKELPKAYIDRVTSQETKFAHLRYFSMQIFTAIATQTNEFMLHLNIPRSDHLGYLRKHSMFRGSLDAMVIEKRCIVVARGREHDEERNDDANFSPPIARHYENVLFCLETIFATTKSVSNFNKELEENITWKISNILQGKPLSILSKVFHWLGFGNTIKYLYTWGLVVGLGAFCLLLIRQDIFAYLMIAVFILFPRVLFYWAELRDFSKLRYLLNTARTLSPCEDFSSNIEPSLRTEATIRAAQRAKSFGLDILIDTVHNRMENYGHFINTYYASLNTKLALFFTLIVICMSSAAFVYGKINGNTLRDILTDAYTKITKHVDSNANTTEKAAVILTTTEKDGVSIGKGKLLTNTNANMKTKNKARPNNTGKRKKTKESALLNTDLNEEMTAIHAQKSNKKALHPKKPQNYPDWEER